jgi:hypothetical protein
LMQLVANEAAQCSAWGFGQLQGETKAAAAGPSNVEVQLQQLQAQLTTLNQQLSRPPAGFLDRLLGKFVGR